MELRAKTPSQLDSLLRENCLGSVGFIEDQTQIEFKPQTGNAVSLTYVELVTLCHLELGDLSARDLAYLRTCPDDTWGKVRADHLEQKLIPDGLAEPDPESHIPLIYQQKGRVPQIYRLSQKARTGEYITIVKHTTNLQWSIL